MSALSCYLSPSAIVIATDSLSTWNMGFPPMPANLNSKIKYYPHLKCCFVGLGIVGIIKQYESFIEECQAFEFKMLFNRTKELFHKRIDLSEIREDFIGDGRYISKLFLFGYSDAEKKLMAFRIEIHQDGLDAYEMSMEDALFNHPPVSADDQLRIKQSNPELGIDLLLVELVKQMKNDSDQAATHTTTVGGEIHLTTLVAEPHFTCIFSVPYRFEDFNKLVFETMALYKPLP